MAKMKCKVNTNGLKKFQQNLKKLNDSQRGQFTEAAVKELAARLLAKVIPRTPVRKPEDCPPGVKGGTLRRGWTGGDKVDAVRFAKSLNVTKTGSTYSIEIINPVEYAPYVEFGHRTANHSGWVDGKFMLTISEQELQADAPKYLMNKLEKFVGGVFN